MMTSIATLCAAIGLVSPTSRDKMSTVMRIDV